MLSVQQRFFSISIMCIVGRGNVNSIYILKKLFQIIRVKIQFTFVSKPFCTFDMRIVYPFYIDAADILYFGNHSGGNSAAPNNSQFDDREISSP